MRKIICIDIDNTLCRTFKNHYSKSIHHTKKLSKKLIVFMNKDIT